MAALDQVLVIPRGDTVATDSAAQPMLKVSVIGGAGFRYDGKGLDLRNRKGRAMLAYLALSATGIEQRERLAGLFWSEFGEQNARATLRQAVHELREAMMAIGCNVLIGTRTTFGLQPGSFDVDLDELTKAVTAGEVPDALVQDAHLAERLLAGYDDLDPSFHGWLTARRQTLHDRLMRGLEDGYRDAILPRWQRRRLADAALRLDPTHEEACRVVMQAAAEDGGIGVALRAYDELYRLLGDEYDMEPSEPTQALVAKIKQGKFENTGTKASSQSQEAKTISSKPALFVERFVMSGIGEDQAHLVAGFRIELIACLARFREWYVTGTDGDLTAEHGGVPVSSRYAVTTTAYKAGSTINVVMVLHERPSNLAIWGERFELRPDSWFDAQQRIVRRIAATLNVQMSTERQMRLSHVPEVSLQAHDIWLRAQLVIGGYDAGDWTRTSEMLERAVEREPAFSPLYSSLAQLNNGLHFVQPGKLRGEVHVQRTLALAQRAAALDPRDSRAHLCLGWALAFCRRYSQAELSMEIACELNSNDPHTLMSSAAFYGYKGETDRALRQALTSMELTLIPTLGQWQYLASIRYLDGDYEGAAIAAERAQDAVAHMSALRAAALSKLGRHEEAKRDIARFYAKVGATWAGEAPPTEAAIGRWLLHIYPFSRAVIWERWRDGVALAGIPVAGLAYHG